VQSTHLEINPSFVGECNLIPRLFLKNKKRKGKYFVTENFTTRLRQIELEVLRNTILPEKKERVSEYTGRFIAIS